MLLSPARPARAGTNRRPATAPTARGRGRYHGCATCSGLYYCIQKGCSQSQASSLYVWRCGFRERDGRERITNVLVEPVQDSWVSYCSTRTPKKNSTKVLKQGLIQTVMRLI
jgi:hypothetical protein